MSHKDMNEINQKNAENDLENAFSDWISKINSIFFLSNLVGFKTELESFENNVNKAIDCMIFFIYI